MTSSSNQYDTKIFLRRDKACAATDNSTLDKTNMIGKNHSANQNETIGLYFIVFTTLKLLKHDNNYCVRANERTESSRIERASQEDVRTTLSVKIRKKNRNWTGNLYS